MPRIKQLLSFLIWALSSSQASALIGTPMTRFGSGCTQQRQRLQLQPHSPSSPSIWCSSPTKRRFESIQSRRKFVHRLFSTVSFHHEPSTSNQTIIEFGASLIENNGNGNTTPPHNPSTQTKTTREKVTRIVDLPRHIAFICDGNSRWAKHKSLPESMGHVAGADRVVNLIKALQKYNQPPPPTDSSKSESQNDMLHNQSSSSSRIDKLTSKQQPQVTNNLQHQKSQSTIEYCTLFAFSTENWSRPTHEISTLFKVIQRTASQYRQHEYIRNGKIQIELLGNIHDDRIPHGAREELLLLAEESKFACEQRLNEEQRQQHEGEEGDVHVSNNNRGDGVLHICLAINYGGRADILQATQKILQSILSRDLSPEEATAAALKIDENALSQHLYTANIPDPDLIIRTGGEKRLSNFLLWDGAYSELYFSDLLWPDFGEVALEEALGWYAQRIRRFGGR